MVPEIIFRDVNIGLRMILLSIKTREKNMKGFF